MSKKKQNRILTELCRQYDVDFHLLKRFIHDNGLSPMEALSAIKAGRKPEVIKTGPTTPPLTSEQKLARREQNKFLKLMADTMGLNFRDLHRLVREKELTPGQAAARLLVE